MDYEDILEKLLFVLVIIVVVIYIGVIIYCYANYGNLPPDEVPSWVHWFMLG